MLRATRILGLAVLLACLACEKTPPKPEVKVPEPDDLIAVLSVSSGKAAVDRAAGYANSVSPGSGAVLQLPMIAQALASAVGAPALDGLDLNKPLHLLVLDPKKHASPVVIVGAVADEAKLKKTPGVTVQIDSGQAAVGPDAAVKAAGKYGLSVLARRAAPAATTVSASVGKIVARYREDIANFRKQMAQTMAASPSPGIAKVLDAEIDLVLKLADQTDEIRIAADVDAGDAYLDIALVPKPGTTFAKVNAAQKAGIKTDLLARLPDVDRPSMIMAGWYVLGPARAPLLELMGDALEALIGTKLDAAMLARINALLDGFDGNMAAVIGTAPGGGFRMHEIFSVADGAKTAAVWKEIFAAMISPSRTIELLGMKMSWEGKPEAAVHDGVAIAEYVMKFDVSSFPEAEREMMRRFYGEEGMHFYVAGFDKSFALTLGSDGQAAMERLIDTARKGGGQAMSPAVAAALGGATRRKSSFAMFMDMTQSMASMLGTNPPPSSSGITIDIGSADGAAHMRFTVPAAHVKEITAMMGSARP